MIKHWKASGQLTIAVANAMPEDAYGSRLLVLYTPWCRDACSEEPDAGEAALLAACREEGAHCVSARPEMA